MPLLLRTASAVPMVCSILFWLLTPKAAESQYGPPVGVERYDDSSLNVFRDGELMEIRVTMDAADLQAIIDDPFSDDYKMSTVRIVNSVLDETVEMVGIRARGNTARGNQKFPWKLSFNEFVQGRRFHGVKKFNLASDASDPSLSRSKTLWDAYRAFGVPASRANYVRMIINDGALVDGVYLNIEQVDDDMVSAWFGNEDGVLYKCRFKDVPASLRFIEPGTPEVYAALESYEEELQDDDFQLLADFIDFVDNSDDATFRAEIGDWLNVDGFLRAHAADVASGNWDSYWFGGNNYYLYENTETGRLDYLPWDLDQTFGMDYFFFPVFFGENWATRDYDEWGDGGFGGSGGPGQPPLMERILEVPAYDRQFQRLIRQVAEGPLSFGANAAKLDVTRTLLEPFIFRGSFSGPTMDGGLEPENFAEAFDQPAEYEAFAGATWGMKPFLRERQEYVRENYPDPPALIALRINEVVADNDSVIADEAGQFEDYFEIYNDEEFAVDIGGLRISDRAGNPRGWRIPDGIEVPAKGFLLFWADEDLADGPLHTDFKLSRSGEGVWLFDRDEALNLRLASLVFPQLGVDEAFGSVPDGSDLVEPLAVVSPGASNTQDTASLTLAVSGVCPGQLTFYGYGSGDQDQIAVLAAASAGNEEVPVGNCAGRPLELGAPLFLLGSSSADVNGTSAIERLIPEAACGVLLAQGVDLGSCEVSDSVAP